ncbi:PEP/pyruvate-binding domain-containing protein [Lichenifustis flavocetrariae]|uniref:PEP-utilizing enzyme n=1 Tax=Lichenifustis flavocetrariae TaxID=2949735 RepID=A0AA41Z360_9HYPH|nr:PEP/pyruvate-binding domain-containing protein [Lichenifustis flavocetrariae]MCW6512146.1 PEP-utilizing enzyme [Lichenifustis flavocetrariae]
MWWAMFSQLSPVGPRQPFYMVLAGEALPPGKAVEVGNKAYNLMCMASVGLPVPAAFVLPTHWCEGCPPGHERATALTNALADGIARLERATGQTFGSGRKPLLVSVRSGASISMPGMMETVLDVGLNDESVEGLIRTTGNPRLAWDSYRRLIQGFAEVVQALPVEPFDRLIQEALVTELCANERGLDHVALRQLAKAMLARFRDLAGTPFPQSPTDQLSRATDAVFRSWDAPKAAEYRRLNHIDDAIGTAVTIQTMVFGNAGGRSGAGVGFTRDPATGENVLYIDFQFDGQGEDVVAGRIAIRDPERLRSALPAIWDRLEEIRGMLETMFGDVQDFEFTVQDGKLYLLQTRTAKRTPWAALRIAVDLVEEGLVKPADALERLHGIDLDGVVRNRLSGTQDPPLASATVAGIGVAAGRIALDPAAAKRYAAGRDPAILVRRETTTADILGMADAAGILTALGGRTSHAAVVARQLGKVCLVGCSELSSDLGDRTCRIGPRTLAEGDWLTLDGNSGFVYAGHLQTLVEHPERELAAIRKWVR